MRALLRVCVRACVHLCVRADKFAWAHGQMMQYYMLAFRLQISFIIQLICVPRCADTIFSLVIPIVAMMRMVTRGHDEAVTVWPLAADLLPPTSLGRTPCSPVPSQYTHMGQP